MNIAMNNLQWSRIRNQVTGSISQANYYYITSASTNTHLFPNLNKLKTKC